MKKQYKIRKTNGVNGLVFEIIRIPIETPSILNPNPDGIIGKYTDYSEAVRIKNILEKTEY